ncbi:hypothetical protein ACWC9T_36070 [Kitasatospora sp. NPDC001159]
MAAIAPLKTTVSPVKATFDGNANVRTGLVVTGKAGLRRAGL